jgi:hypothetical protein
MSLLSSRAGQAGSGEEPWAEAEPEPWRIGARGVTGWRDDLRVVRLVCWEAAPLSEDGAALRAGILGGDGAPPSGIEWCAVGCLMEGRPLPCSPPASQSLRAIFDVLPRRTPAPRLWRPICVWRSRTPVRRIGRAARGESRRRRSAALHGGISPSRDSKFPAGIENLGRSFDLKAALP